MSKIIGWILGIIFLGAIGVAVFFYYEPDSGNKLAAENAPEDITEVRNESTEMPPATSPPISIDWNFVDSTKVGDDFSGPSTEVSIVINRNEYYIAGVAGSCFVIEDSDWELYPGETTGVICWWAGGGTEIGIFEEGGELIVKTGVIDEGTAETEGFRGGFRILGKIDVAKGALVPAIEE